MDAGTPEQEFIGQNHSLPEGDPKSKGFQIRIENSDFIFSGCQLPNS